MFLFVCFYLCLCSALKLMVLIECPEELLAHTNAASTVYNLKLKLGSVSLFLLSRQLAHNVIFKVSPSALSLCY